MDPYRDFIPTPHEPQRSIRLDPTLVIDLQLDIEVPLEDELPRMPARVPFFWITAQTRPPGFENRTWCSLALHGGRMGSLVKLGTVDSRPRWKNPPWRRGHRVGVSVYYDPKVGTGSISIYYPDGRTHIESISTEFYHPDEIVFSMSRPLDKGAWSPAYAFRYHDITLKGYHPKWDDPPPPVEPPPPPPPEPDEYEPSSWVEYREKFYAWLKEMWERYAK